MLKKTKLDTKDVAELLQIPIVKVQRWVHQGKIPCRFEKNHYYFKRKEIVEWAKSHNMQIAPGVLEEKEEIAAQELSLRAGIENGGAFFGLDGDDIYSVLKNAVNALDLPQHIEPDSVFEELINREEIASTGIGKGVAIPHPRRSLDLQLDAPFISVFFLKNKIDFNSIDGKPVFVLFLMFSPSTQAHLNLLSRLSFLLRDKDFLDRLEACSGQSALVELIADKEQSLLSDR
jgi:PTS system nitrogen regulatory IIA component